MQERVKDQLNYNQIDHFIIRAQCKWDSLTQGILKAIDKHTHPNHQQVCTDYTVLFTMSITDSNYSFHQLNESDYVV